VLHYLAYRLEFYRGMVAVTDVVFKTEDSSVGVWGNGGIALILLTSFLLPHIVYIIGFIIRHEDPKYRDKKVKEYHAEAIKNDELMLLLSYSVSREMPIMFTLENGKVYVGWPNSEPNPTHDLSFIRILPYLSGYRDPKTHREKFTTDYQVVLDLVKNKNHDDKLAHLSLDDFRIILPVNKIISAHLFDIKAYVEFVKEANKEASVPEHGSQNG
jgi:hypothetical protein